MQNDWQIKSRSHLCTSTGRPFEDEEAFYTLLFLEKDGSYRREDLCEEAFNDRNDNIKPFSFWKSLYQSPPPPEPEALPRESAESLLRKYIDEDDPAKANARFILALMLERKKTLKHTDSQETDDGRLLIYEHAKTGEIFLIPDPGLRLDEIESVQEQVATLLGRPAKPRDNPKEAPAEAATTPSQESPSNT